MKIKNAVLIILFANLLMGAAKAETLSPYLVYYSGPISSQLDKHTYKAWGISYVFRSESPFGWSLSYHNEGYFPGHYRDGLGLQWLAHTEPFNPHWSFAAAIGPYTYFDTVFSEKDAPYYNRHGLGIKLDLTTTYDYSPFVFMLGLDHVHTFDSFDTTALLFGLGFKLKDDPVEFLSNEGMHELTLYTGRVLVNASKGNVERSLPLGIEYRYHSTIPHLDGTIALLREGSTSLTDRNGLAAEVWATKGFFSDRFTLGMGVGPYIAYEKKPEDNQRTVINGLLSATASYVVVKPWLLGRITWHRVITSYDRDSDVFLLGLGFNF